MTEEENQKAPPTGKDAIYAKIVEVVTTATGKRISRAKAREIFDTSVEEIFALACSEGTVRLNGGFGSFHTRSYQAGNRTLPSGQKVEFGERRKLRYEEGVVVKALIANGGDLVEALKARTAAGDSEDDVSQSKPKPAATGDVDTDLD